MANSGYFKLQRSAEIQQFSGLKRLLLVLVTIVTLRPYSVKYVFLNSRLVRISFTIKLNLISNEVELYFVELCRARFSISIDYMSDVSQSNRRPVIIYARYRFATR